MISCHFIEKKPNDLEKYYLYSLSDINPGEMVYLMTRTQSIVGKFSSYIMMTINRM